MRNVFVGIEIGGTKLQIVSGNQRGAIVERKRFQVDRSKGAAGIQSLIENELTSVVSQWSPSAIGVGFGGPVDHRTGRVARSHQIEGWSDFPIREWLQKHSGLPVWVENDANTAALAEARCGAGQGFDPVFYITLGSGIGGGLVSKGTIYHGASPGESEIGHLRLSKDGTLLEEVCSGWAVDRRIRKLKTDGVKSPLCDLLPEAPGGEAKFIVRALEAGDPVASTLLAEVAEDLAFALSHVTHLFHPAVTVLGGGLSLIGEPLRAEIDRALPRFLMSVFHGKTQVRLASLREDAVPVGCLLGAQTFISGE